MPSGQAQFLAVGTIKIATLLPFLLLFFRKADFRTWISLAVVALVLSVVCISPVELPARCQECLQNISVLGQPGRPNDYSYANPVSNHILSLDHLFYRLGMRDRRWIQLAQFTSLFVLGAWIGWQIADRAKVSMPAACSLAACYSALFLYHRHYDMGILVLPLVYATGRALSEQGLRRWLFVVCCLAVLLVLYIRRDVLDSFSAIAASGGLRGRLAECFGLPYGDWCILTALFSLAIAERWRPAS